MDGSQRRRSASARERRRGQTETIGVVLLLGMTVIGAMSVVAFGATAFQDARDSSAHESVSHAMTQFDSQAAIVALGDATTRSMALGGTDGGTYTVDSDAGWMSVSHVNDTDVETFYNDSLGALVYSDGEVEIAYQGGGVWRRQGDASVMVSPPEFHYRDATLTLPLISVNGSASKSGAVRASIRNEMSARPVFPNASGGFYWGGDGQYRNPVSDGNVTVTVQSEYYQAWGEYFRTRSDGDVLVHHSNETAVLILRTPTTLGDFDPMPGEGGSVAIQQLGEDHPVNNFTITLKDANPGGGASTFNGMEWSFETDGVQDFEIHLAGSPCKNDEELDVSIYYHDGSGVYEGWHGVVDSTQDVLDVRCDEEELTLNLTGTARLQYQEDVDIDTSGYEFATETVFDQHDDVDGNTTYDADEDDEEEIGFLVNHYLQRLGPTVELTVADGRGGGGGQGGGNGPPRAGQIDESASFGTLDYDQGGGPRYITFLHITENHVTVEFE